MGYFDLYERDEELDAWTLKKMELTWHHVDGGGGGNSKSHGVGLRAPARGPSPLAPSRCSGHPMKGRTPFRNPRSNPIRIDGNAPI